jgi:hypothetical protein
MAELDRIKRERAEEAARKAGEAAAKAEAEEQKELLRGNPLLQEKLAAQGELLQSEARVQRADCTGRFVVSLSWVERGGPKRAEAGRLLLAPAALQADEKG